MLDIRMEHRQKVRNLVQSALLLGSLALVAVGLAWLFIGVAGVIWLVGLSAVAVVVRRRVPTRVQLVMYRAQPLPYAAAPGLHLVVQELARRAGLPSTPALYYLPSPVPNALSAGRGTDTALAVTDGLLRRLLDREVIGVLAHEVSHLRAGDAVALTLADAIGHLARGLAWFGLLAFALGLPLTIGGDRRLVVAAALLALPLVVTRLQLALLRSREFDADLGAARLTSDPEGLACALEDLERSSRRWEWLFLPRRRIEGSVLLRSHPATVERARRLRQLERGSDGWRQDYQPRVVVQRRSR